MQAIVDQYHDVKTATKVRFQEPGSDESNVKEVPPPVEPAPPPEEKPVAEETKSEAPKEEKLEESDSQTSDNPSNFTP